MLVSDMYKKHVELLEVLKDNTDFAGEIGITRAGQTAVTS